MFWTHKTLKSFGKFPVRKDIHDLNKKRKVEKKKVGKNSFLCNTGFIRLKSNNMKPKT